MSGTYLTLTNNTLARLNEVQLTSSNFSNARGIQVQAQNAVNESIRFINQKEYNFPFNHATETKTLTAGSVRYSLPTSTKHVDYNTFRLVRDEDLATSGGKLSIIQYNDYINQFVTQEDEINTTTLDGSLTDSATTITVASTSGFDSDGVEQFYHGDRDGYVYNHDTGNDFNPAGVSTNVEAEYQSPDFDYGDLGTLKTLDYAKIAFTPEGDAQPTLRVRYDYDSLDTPQPQDILLTAVPEPALFGVALFNNQTFGAAQQPLVRQSLTGSGHSNFLKFLVVTQEHLIQLMVYT